MYKLVLILCFSSLFSSAQSLNQAIKLNQVGFYPQAPKLAVVTGSTPESAFFITTTNLRDTVFRGSLGALRKSNNSSTETRTADFSSLTKPGTYVVLVPRLGHSYVFVIGDQVNEAVGIASLKAYYYQRASMPLEAWKS